MPDTSGAAIISTPWSISVNGPENSVWHRFVQHFEDDARQRGISMRHGAIKAMITAELARYGAYTDWIDVAGPIWFTTQEAHMEFILKWS